MTIFNLVIIFTITCFLNSFINSHIIDDVGKIDYPSDYNDIDVYGEEVDKRSPVLNVYRRSCIRRGNSCDYRPYDCCSSGACRCNLWGANCRCQQMGLIRRILPYGAKKI